MQGSRSYDSAERSGLHCIRFRKRISHSEITYVCAEVVWFRATTTIVFARLNKLPFLLVYLADEKKFILLVPNMPDFFALRTIYVSL
jgi:hypothetical protein